MPRLPLFLGLAGLIPFWVAAIGVWVLVDPVAIGVVLQGQVIYAAIIASFLGAVHWGVALTLSRATELDDEDTDAHARSLKLSRGMFVWGVIPAIISWIVVAGSPLVGMAWVPVFGMIVVLAIALFADQLSGDHNLVPSWYLRLRVMLTLGAQGALAISLAGAV